MSNYKFETLQLHVGQEQPDPATDSRAVPIYQTTSYVFKNSAHAAARFGLADAGNIYGRLTNSTQDVLEKRIAALEGGVAALALASGAAAINYTIQALAQDGGHIVAQKTIYGGSYNLLEHTLPHFGITATFVDAHNLAEVENAIQGNTRAIYLETLGNPNSDIPDIDAIAEIAHRHSLPLVIDNTFGTPYLIRPIEHGADIVVHSRRSSSAVTARRSAASSSIPASSIGRRAGIIRRLLIRIRVTTAFPSQTRSAQRRSSPTSARFSCATPARRFRPSMPSCSCRAWRRCPCVWSATRRTRRKLWRTLRIIRRWSM